MIDFVFVQADGFDQVHLDLVAGGNASDEVFARSAGVLSHGKDRWNVIARVGILSCEEGVVVVELADCYTVGPSSPLRGHFVADAKNRGAGATG